LFHFASTLRASLLPNLAASRVKEPSSYIFLGKVEISFTCDSPLFDFLTKLKTSPRVLDLRNFL
jgi:hypothetical protein